MIFIFLDFSLRFMAGRRRYLVNFSTMVQVSLSVMFLMLGEILFCLYCLLFLRENERYFEWCSILLLLELWFCVLLQVNEDSGNRRPIMLEAVDNPSSVASTSRRDEAASSSSSANKGSGEDSQGTSQDKPSKKAKKEKQEKESSGKNLSWQWSSFHLSVEKLVLY